MMRMMHQLRVAMCVMHLLGGLCDLLLNFGLLLGTRTGCLFTRCLFTGCLFTGCLSSDIGFIITECEEDDCPE